MRIVVALVGLTMLWTQAAQAEDRNPAEPTDADRAVVEDCLNKASTDGGNSLHCVGAVSDPCLADPDNQSTPMIEACLERESIIWDERLNDDYKALMQGLDDEPKAKLKAGQKAWITVRDTTCDIESAFWSGGTGLGGAIAGCMLRETATRDLSLSALRAYLDQ